MKENVSGCFFLNTVYVSQQQLTALASFVCDDYSPEGIQIHDILELHLYLFCKHMTMGALKQHLQKVNLQAKVWGQASVAHQEFVLPTTERIH